MREYTLNMLSHADQVKGQGVLSAYEEELALVTGRLDRLEGDGADYRIRVRVNARTVGDVTHIHTVNPEFFLQLPLIKAKGIAVGSVHFLPETMDQSLHIPRLFRKVFYSYLIQFYKSMDHLVTVNPCFIPKLAAYGIDPEKVTYIPNYVSAKRFSKVDASGAWIRSGLPWSAPASCRPERASWSLPRSPSGCRRCSLSGRATLPLAT